MVKTMEEVYDLRQGAADHPHRHDYYTILLVKQANGVHKIDFKDYPMKGPEVFFIAPGQMHQVIEEGRSVGYIITFSKDFLVQNGVNECFVIDINLFREYGDAPSLGLNASKYLELEGHVNNMLTCLSGPSRFRLEAVSAHLKLFLITCNDAMPAPDTSNTQQYQTSVELLRKFKLLVEQHYRNNHQVRFYAEQLSITSDYLNKVIKGSIGVSAKDYILDRLLVEAKRELIYSGASSKEIGYNLGFSDPAYFSSFFKKQTGQSITDYRNENRK